MKRHLSESQFKYGRLRQNMQIDGVGLIASKESDIEVKL